MQEYLVAPWQKIISAPNLQEPELAMVEPLTVGFHAVKRGRIGTTDTVAVMGCGMIGAGALIAASRSGATVIAVDIDDTKLELARKLGARHLVNSASSDLHARLMEVTDGNGPDMVIEAAGRPQTYRSAVDEVAFSGQVVCIGYAAEDVAFATKLFVQKELDILGSRNATPDDFRAVISCLEEGSLPLDEMITRVVAPGEAAGAVREWAADPGKVMKIMVKMT
jgi:threonine dehydrogenase-like Zn-dependent dehydrogenase